MKDKKAMGLIWALSIGTIWLGGFGMGLANNEKEVQAIKKTHQEELQNSRIIRTEGNLREYLELRCDGKLLQRYENDLLKSGLYNPIHKPKE